MMNLQWLHILHYDLLPLVLIMLYVVPVTIFGLGRVGYRRLVLRGLDIVLLDCSKIEMMMKL